MSSCADPLVFLWIGFFGGRLRAASAVGCVSPASVFLFLLGGLRFLLLHCLRMCEVVDCVPAWVGRVGDLPRAAIGSLFYIVRRRCGSGSPGCCPRRLSRRAETVRLTAMRSSGANDARNNAAGLPSAAWLPSPSVPANAFRIRGILPVRPPCLVVCLLPHRFRAWSQSELL